MAGLVGRKGKTIFVVPTFLVLVAVVLFFSRIGYCPFVGKIKAEKKLAAYILEQGYRADSLKVQYNLYDDMYTCRLDENLLGYRLQNNSIHDEKVNVQLNERLMKAHKDIIGQFPANLIFPEQIFMWSTVNADNYAQTAERLYLLGVYNTADLSDGESEKMPAAIATDFIAHMGDKYNITGIQLIYADKNGMYDIEIRADTFQPLEYEQMLAATKKRPEKELPENYLEWRRGVS